MERTIVSQIEHDRIIVIIRRVYNDQLKRLVEALNAGGIRMIEVTFDQADPACLEMTGNAISQLKACYGSELFVGAGTVISKEQVETAFKAGAQYVISPNVDETIIACTKHYKLTSIPGAMTPSEILSAYKFGADVVKVFPAIDLGLGYIKNVRGPITHVKLLATAGINEENFGAFLRSGYTGAGISGRLTERKILESGDYAEFTARAKAFCEIARKFNEGESA